MDGGERACMGALIDCVLLSVINQRRIKSKSQGWSPHQGHSGSIAALGVRITAFKDVWKGVGVGWGVVSKTLLMPHGPMGI